MLTLHDLTAGSDPLLAPLVPDADIGRHAARAVADVQQCDPLSLTPGAWRSGTLAVLAPPALHTRVDQVAHSLAPHAAAVVLAGPDQEQPDADAVAALTETLAAAGLPLLAPARPTPAAVLVEQVRAAIRRAATAHHHRTTALLHLVDRLYRSGTGPDGLLPQLRTATGAGVYLAAPGDIGWTVLAGDGCRDALWRARRRGARTSMVSASGQHVVLTPVGARTPHPVLAAVRAAQDGPWPAHLRELLTLAATQAALLRHPLETHAREETWRRSRRAHRTGILQALMTGQWEAGARMAAADPALHGLRLPDGEGVMAVLACSPRARERLTRACEAGLPHALVVQCPAHADHVLIAAPAIDGSGRPLATALRGLLSGQRHRGVGVSTPQPWDHLVYAYAAARQALAASGPETVTTHTGTADLAAALATVPGATGWARRVVAMATVGATTRRADLARLALTAGISGAASLARADRSHVRKALVEALVRLGLDHRQMPHRAVADLAFQIAALDNDGHDGREGRGAGLDELLFSATAHAWSTATLAPLLAADPPTGGWLGPRTTTPCETDPIDLLVLYVSVGCSMSATGAALGLGRRATHTRLTAAAAALGHPITDTHGTGPHPALWALLAGGHLPPTYTPDPAQPVLDLRTVIPRQATVR